MPNTNEKIHHITFHYSADPPALSVVNDDASRGYWLEFGSDEQVVALHESLSFYLNKKYRAMCFRERANASEP